MALSQATAQRCCAGRLAATLRRARCVCPSARAARAAAPGWSGHSPAAPSLAASRSSTRTRAVPPEFVAAVADSTSPATSARTVVALLLVVFIIIQGPKGEGMINKMNESRMFGNFTQTKNFVSVGTWGLVGGFLLLSAFTALK